MTAARRAAALESRRSAGVGFEPGENAPMITGHRRMSARQVGVSPLKPGDGPVVNLTSSALMT
jgi:hypothetical protein